jgi:hypothetical protein
MNHFNQAGDFDTATPAGNQGAVRDLLALTDEQILEIEPEAQGATGGEEKTKSSSVTAAAPGSATQRAAGQSAGTRAATSNTAGAGDAAGVEPPPWLVHMMADPQSGGEARDFWHGVTQARQDAAAYREVFAQPAEARAAAQRARTLDEIDRAYFTGNASDRSQLAATIMREDPAAFREMVFEGLRALEEAEKGRGAAHGAGESRLARAFAGASGVAQGTTGASAPAANAPVTGTTAALTPALNPGANSGLTSGVGAAGAQHGNAEHDARVAAYVSFEKSANEDLERSVGSAINRTLDQALPITGHGDGGLKSRLVGAIRQDVEKALQGDRQLGEQVAQLLSGKQLNNEARAQVVRLIGERAEQLVPGVAKRALKDWTQSTLAAHRERTGRGAAAGARQEVAAVATSASGRGDSQNKPGRDAAASTRGAAARSVDYRKFSDEQILEI